MTQFHRILKRAFDVVSASAGLFLLAPAACLLAVFLKATCGGPLLYCQRRIGRYGRPFQCVKFRTMYVGAEKQARGAVTTVSDSRVTPIGRFLRNYKLDELPQLWNVLLGKMSFVGPRPDVPGYADLLQGDDRKVLELKPGITGPASIFFRHEERLLASASDPVTYNDRVVWPMKVLINREYLEKWGFWKDIGYILITIMPFLNNIFRLLPPAPHTLDELERARKWRNTG